MVQRTMRRMGALDSVRFGAGRGAGREDCAGSVGEALVVHGGMGHAGLVGGGDDGVHPGGVAAHVDVTLGDVRDDSTQRFGVGEVA